MTKVRVLLASILVSALIATPLVGWCTAQRSLPVLERRAEHAGDTLAFLLTGDGGWAAIDRAMTHELNANGISVVGLSSLSYFWNPRTPESTTADVERLLRKYLKRWKADRIVMIGYSRGADIVPFIVNRLPPDLRSRIDLVALLGVEPTVGFELHPWDAIRGRGRSSDFPVAPEAHRLDATKVLCVAGTEEVDSLCPALKALGAETVVFEGGHHFGGRYREIGGAIVAALRARQR